MTKRKPVKTLNSELDAAEICRRNGWRKGTLLEGEEDGELDTIEITAVGEREILTKSVCASGAHTFDGEKMQDFSRRDWRKVAR